MNPGELRHRITIEKLTRVETELGFTNTWTTFAAVWAKKIPLQGREYLQSLALNTQNTVKFYIRYLKDLDTSMRIVHDGKVHDIKFIEDKDELHKEMYLICEVKPNV